MATKKPLATYSGQFKELAAGDTIDFSATFGTQSANQVFAGPTSGGAAAPAFRALVANDIPVLDAAKISSGTIATARLGSGSADASTFLRGDQTYTDELVDSSNPQLTLAHTSGSKFTRLQVDTNKNLTIGQDSPNYNPTLELKYGQPNSSVYSDCGIKLNNRQSGSIVRLHSLSNGLYLTDDGGTAAPMLLGTRTNPADSSTFIASSGRWIISAGGFVVNNATWNATAQDESYSTARPQYGAMYNTSNYGTWNVGSSGINTFNAVGSSAKFVFSDPVEVSGALSATGLLKSDDTIECTNGSSGLILKSPGGTRYLVSVTDLGVLVQTPI